MELLLIDSETNKITISDSVFGCEYNEHLIHQVTTAYLAAGRSGTQSQKTRSEVRGGGIKPWKQKGSGRARAGTIRSPIWRKGGVTFAAKPRSYEQKVNKKMYRAAIRSIFSELIRNERLLLVNDFVVDSPKTQNLLTQLHTLNIKQNVLIVTDNVEENLYLAARNLPYVDVRLATAIDPISLIKYHHVLVTSAAIKHIEDTLI
jgi:large subunit ribosomal protein L4